MELSLNYQRAKKIIIKITLILLGWILVLGTLHYFLGEEYILEDYYYFNLDDEGTLATWFSGVLFFLFGCTGYVTYLVERSINSQRNKNVFKLPVLWVGVCLIGFYLSLDEITSLHEHLFLHEYDILDEALNLSEDVYDFWALMFAPAIVLMLGFIITFFVNRFNNSKIALRLVYSGIAIWLIALMIEGLRESFYDASYNSYSISVLFEESFESIGTTLLFSSVLFYLADIGLDLTPERVKRLTIGSKILSKRSIIALGFLLFVLLLLSWVVVLFGDDAFFFY